MAEFKFSCQGCGQHIQCDQQWSGQQIICPVCGASLTVPFLAAPVAAPPPRVEPAASAAPAPQRRLVPKKEPFPVQKVVGWTVGAVIGAVAITFLLHKADTWQVKLDQKEKDVADHSSGGEMVHIAKLYETLDATDPAKMEQSQMKARARGEKAVADMLAQLKVQPDPTLIMPLATPQWGLDDSAAQIPSGRVHGSISGQEFTPDSVRLDPGGYGRVLSFQQGVGTTADHEIFIYLNLNPNDASAGRSWTVTKETKAKDAAQIVKRWTANPKFAPIAKTYGSGYSLRLEFDQPTRDWQGGRIYLALPDTNQTVLAGAFSLPTPQQAAQLQLR